MPDAARPRRPRWAFGVLVLAVLAVCALAAWRPWSAPATPTAAVAAEAPAAATGPAPIALPEHPRVLIFGDSWTYGSAATAPTDGYAYVVARTLGWDAVVDGVRGSGYLKPGLDGGAFGERIAALDPALDPDLIIVQGSINDRRLPATGYRTAVDEAWDALSARFPDAQIVVLGPAPQVLPVEAATARIDVDLADLAAERGWWYVSPVREEWITPENYAAVIDTGEIGRDHPSTAGHAYLAERLAEALGERAAPADVIAGGTSHPASRGLAR
ncbi:SGNH/GDSL hydrolase family protein [Microbacterium sp. NPDC091313]